MEECKPMGLKVLGPDINESIKGFSPNRKGEIRFGLGGLKGVGENAIENIIEERKKGGAFTNIFDFIKRVNQKSVNKKSLESLAYSGAFDCFNNLHRAQYFHLADGERTNGLEKIIGYGQVQNELKTGTTNTLFGDLAQVMEISIPKIAACDTWGLIEKLEHEKDITGIYLSGHPLDHFRFELKYYGIMNLTDFNEIKDSPTLAQTNAGRVLRIAGLVVDAQHRVTKTGRNFGILSIGDFSGKTEIALWSDDYVKYTNYLDKGKNLLIHGFYKQSWKGDNYEFKVTSINMLETAKESLTKSIDLNMHAASISKELVFFLEKNIKNNPGKSSLKFNILEPIENLKVSLYSKEKGFTMNEEMADFLLGNPDVEVNVGLVS